MKARGQVTRTLAALASVLLVLVFSGQADTPPAASRASSETDLVFSLLANNHLFALAISDGRVVQQLSLGAVPREPQVGHYLALSPDRTRLVVLAPRAGGTRDRLAVLDAHTGRLLALRMLSKDISFRSVALGRRTTRIFLFGNRRDRTPVVQTLAAKGGALLGTRVFRDPRRLDWRVYQGTVSSDETRAFVSYHSASTQGIDWIDLQDRRSRCISNRRRTVSCISAHGAIAEHAKRLIAATGSPLLLEIDRGGRVLRRLDTALAGNHLMEFTYQVDGGRLFAAGSCGYSGGLSVIDLGTGSTRILAGPLPSPTEPAPVRPGVCGERLALGRDSLLLIAKNRRPVPVRNQAGEILVIESGTGRLVRSLSIPSEAVDLLAP